MLEKISAGVFGTCVADALGVPVEFRSREQLKQIPVTFMRGYGTHDQPVGTWSDDSSMLLCLADSLGICGGLNGDDVMDRFCRWYDRGDYTPWGNCFDCGISVGEALRRYKQGTPAFRCGGTDTYSNGNGSLMRILPMAYGLYSRYGADLMSWEKAVEQIHQASSLTHAHPISLSACGIYVLTAAKLLDGMDLQEAIRTGIREGLAYYDADPRFACHMEVWGRIREVDVLADLPEEEIRSGGYVVQTLEAALWCLLNTDNYRDAALMAVNLGGDTDTTAAVVGGLAGLAYGMAGIPRQWLEELAAANVVEDCCRSLCRWCEASE